MVKITALLFFLMSSTVFAAGPTAYNMKVDLSLNGKHIGSPQVTTTAGDQASVIIDSKNQKYFIDVVANEEPAKDGGKSGVNMNFTVGTVSATGKKTVISNAGIIAVENEKAQLSQTNNKGVEEFSLAVVVNRKAL